MGLDRDDVDVALFFSTAREGMGDEDLRDTGVGRTVSDSILSGVISG